MTVSVYAPGLTVAVVDGAPPGSGQSPVVDPPPQSLPPVADASAQPTPYLTTDDGFGPQRESMVSALWLPWPTPSTTLVATHKFTAAGEKYSYDVTALVRKFVAGENTGFELRRPGTDPSNVSFMGRLSPSGVPTLTIVTPATAWAQSWAATAHVTSTSRPHAPMPASKSLWQSSARTT